MSAGPNIARTCAGLSGSPSWHCRFARAPSRHREHRRDGGEATLGERRRVPREQMEIAGIVVRGARRVARAERVRDGGRCGGMLTPLLLERFPDLDPQKLQDPAHAARAVRFAVSQPRESVAAEITVLPV